jgi:predicted MFS family arabinose efflux permease
LARPVVELLAGFVGTVFMGDETEFAILSASLGFGAIFSGVWLAGKGDVRGLTNITIYAVFLNAIAITLFAATGIFWLAAFALAISGFAQVASGTGSQTLIQTVVADHMRGRVLGVWSLIMRGVPALGALGFGWLAEYVGFSWPVAIGSLAAALYALWVARKRSQLKQQLEQT